MNDCGLYRHSGVPLSKKPALPILEVKESELENFRKHLKKNPIIKD